MKIHSIGLWFVTIRTRKERFVIFTFYPFRWNVKWAFQLPNKTWFIRYRIGPFAVDFVDYFKD